MSNPDTPLETVEEEGGTEQDEAETPTDPQPPLVSAEDEEGQGKPPTDNNEADKAAEPEAEEIKKEPDLTELEDRKANIQQWMEKLAKVKREEFEREEAALTPVRHYLMAHVVPTLTKGLIDVTRARPDDPVEYLAEFLFTNNPGSLNTTLGDKFPKDEK